MKNSSPFPFDNSKTVYGPVKSWRFGMSLGVDPLYYNSTCSFNCHYCQLGHIQNITDLIKEYVKTDIVIKDFESVYNNTKNIDVITFSGSGEPSLAKNLGEISDKLKKLAPSIPQFILTNGAHLDSPIVSENLQKLDRVAIKLDASTQDIFEKINRPHPNIRLEKIIENTINFKKIYKGAFEIQSMFMPLNNRDIDKFAKILLKIGPDLIQLNTPTRPYPIGRFKENRGNHTGIHQHKTIRLKTLSLEQAQKLELELFKKTQIPIQSVYKKKNLHLETSP